MHTQEISFAFNARYCKLGTITPQTRQVWFVLHGYGQLAPYFIRKFQVLEEQGIVVIAPEGLSRFYLDTAQPTGRATDRVGATWMTKESRLTDIGNYIRYLNAIYDTEIHHPIPVTVLGFSQGAATASRWAADGHVKCHRLVLWAGLLPPDMALDAARDIYQRMDTVFVYGLQDPFLTDSRFQEMASLSQQLGIAPRTITFDGKHEIDSPTLLSLI